MNPHNPEKLLFEKYVTGRTRFVLTRERYGAQNTVVLSSKWHPSSVFFTQQGYSSFIRR